MKVRIISFFDFWLSDFKWYRNLTERKGDVWFKLENGNTSFWVREDQHFELKLKVVEMLEKDYPNLDLKDQKEVERAARNIVYELYGE